MWTLLGVRIAFYRGFHLASLLAAAKAGDVSSMQTPGRATAAMRRRGGKQRT